MFAKVHLFFAIEVHCYAFTLVLLSAFTISLKENEKFCLDTSPIFVCSQTKIHCVRPFHFILPHTAQFHFAHFLLSSSKNKYFISVYLLLEAVSSLVLSADSLCSTLEFKVTHVPSKLNKTE